MSDVHPSRRKSDWGSPLVKLAVACCVISMLCLTVSIVVGATTLNNNNQIAKSSDLLTAIQTERRHNLLLSCEQADAQNARITTFLSLLIPAHPSKLQKLQFDQFLNLADGSFPSHSAKDRLTFCEAQSKQKVRIKPSS